MFFAPLPLPFTFLIALLSVAILGGGLWILWGWLVGSLVGTGFLVAGLVMTAWSLLGRWIVLMFRPAGALEPRTIRPDSVERIERPDGTVLNVDVYGAQGLPTIILTHGAGTNRTSWYYVIRALAGRYRVIAWDMPGLGNSTRAPDGDYSLERHAWDLESVIYFAGDGPVVLAGHSMGGMVMLAFCGLLPGLLRARVAGLVLVDTSHTSPVLVATGGGFLRSIQKPVLEPLLHIMSGLSPIVNLMAWMGYLNGTVHLSAMAFGFGGTETRGQLDRAALYYPQAWPGVQAHEMLATFRYDATDVLSTIPVPALVFTGDVDRLIVPETARYLRDHLPNARLVTLEATGHMAIFERHDDLVPAMERFCAAVLGKEKEDENREERLAG